MLSTARVYQEYRQGTYSNGKGEGQVGRARWLRGELTCLCDSYRHNDVDIVIIRENTEGEYSGLEHEVCRRGWA